MVLGAFVAAGTAVLPVSAGGVISRVTVSATGTAAGDFVLITALSTIDEGRDAEGVRAFHVENITTNAFDIVANRAELPEAVTFNWMVFDSA